LSPKKPGFPLSAGKAALGGPAEPLAASA
jgi:hypothetical protein